MQLVIGFAFIAAVALALLLYSTRQFNRIVRWEHDNCRDEWVRDGKPGGVLSRLGDSSFFGSYEAIRRAQFLWLFGTPPWAAGDTGCRGLFRRWRIRVLLVVLALFAAAFAAVSAYNSISIMP